MAKESNKDQWEACKNGCTSRSGRTTIHRHPTACPRRRGTRTVDVDLTGNKPHYIELTIGSLSTPTPAPRNTSNSEALSMAPMGSNSCITEVLEPRTMLQPPASPELGQWSPPAQPILEALTPSFLEQRPSDEPEAMSPQIPSPQVPVGIPETPLTRRDPHLRRPLGSPVRPNQDFNDLLDPLLMSRRLSVEPASGARAVGHEAEMQLDSNDGSLGGSHSTIPVLQYNGNGEEKEEEEEEEILKQKRTRETLKLETMIFQSDKKKRDSYYYNRSRCLKNNFEKLGIYTGCFGILYLHRYFSCKTSNSM